MLTGLSIWQERPRVSGKAWGKPDGVLELTNYPITGPIISGPHQTPFVCQTDTFKLPDGATLGPATDANCSAPTKVQYVYLPKGAKDVQAAADTKAIPGRRRDAHDDDGGEECAVRRARRDRRR